MKIRPDKVFPGFPGVYFFKDHSGTILYVGKAKSLKARTASYFQKRGDWKIDMLLDEAHDLDYILTKNETEALLLEAQMVQEHQPKYNVLLKDGQPFLYILFTQEPLPRITVTRNKKEKGLYFGPFLHKKQARGVVKFLIETFRLGICNKKIENGCLDYHLGRCVGSCMKSFDNQDYLFRIELAQNVLKKDHKKYLASLQEKIKEYNQGLAFEKSRNMLSYIENLDTIFETIRTRFSEDKYENDIFVAGTPHNVPTTLNIGTEIAEFLGLSNHIKTIDCFDISHFQSRYLVGSCIRFTNGKPEKNKFRRFKIKTLIQQDDYAALQEIVGRRYKEGTDLPDLIVIDGGKGQLNAVQFLYPQTPYIALAKREETIFSAQHPDGKKLDVHTNAGKTIIAIRDYAHHFAVSYHTLRRRKGALS